MRKLLLILIMCCAAFAANAENIVSASSASGHPQDEVTLQISLANTDDVVAFQTEIPLGNNLEYVANSATLNAQRITDHAITAAVVGGNLRIFAYSISLTPFVGNEGVLLSFTLRLKNEPGDNVIDVSSSILSSASSSSVDYTYNNGSVTILSPKIQINTGTLNYGHVPIWSEYSLTATITNVGNEPLTITSISFSNAVFSCPSFAATTVQPGNNASFTFKFAPMVKGSVTAVATIASNSVTGNAVINLVADPFAVNELHITNVTGYCDSVVEIPMTMNNMESLIGMQIDVKLPSALEYVGFELSSRKVDHVAVGVVKNDSLRLMAYSPSGSTFTGDNGVIGTLSVRLKGLHGNYYINPFKVVLADVNGENVLSQTYQGYVTIRSPHINGYSSLNMGESSVTETVTRAYTVYNNGNAQMRIDDVVVDQPYWAVAETFPLTVDQYSSTVLHVSYNRELKGAFAATMKIYSNDPQNGLKNVALSGTRYEPNTLNMEADPFSLPNDDVAVAISMDNYSNIVALQANFEYPYQNFSVAASDFQLTERFGTHTLYATPLNDSVYKLIVFSLENVSAQGNNGVVVNVTMHPISKSGNELYTLSMANVVMSGIDGINIYSGNDIMTTFSTTMVYDNTFDAGWNWWSSYVEINSVDGLSLLEESLGHNGLLIKTQNAFVANQYESQGYDYWFGSLTSVNNENGYRIKVGSDCEVELSGSIVEPSSHPITVIPGFTWIGYPVGVQQTITEALSGFTPVVDDFIKGHGMFATYVDGIGWFPEDYMLIPGHGYQYYSNATENKTLTFVDSGNRAEFARNNHYWNNNIHEFADNACIIAVVYVDGVEQYNDNLELGAFVNGECRGSALLRYCEPLGRYFAFITVAGEADETVEFGIVDAENNRISMECDEQLTFDSEKLIGNVNNPVELHFGVMHDNVQPDLVIYPNPVERNTSFTLLAPDNETITEIIVTDAIGNVIGDDTRLNTSGIYIIKVSCLSGNTYFGKLIVK